MKSHRSLVLITVDCLRADHVGFMGYEQPTTPFLDSLASESLVVPTAIVAGAPTYYSLPSILASRYPLALSRDVIGLAPEEPTLPLVLQSSGYATACFAAGNPYVSPEFGYDQGFDTFRDYLRSEDAAVAGTASGTTSGPSLQRSVNRLIEKASHKIRPLGAVYDELYFQYCQRWASSRPSSLDALRRFPAADVVMDQACDWLASVGKGPFFLWLHLMDPHSPYYPKTEALELLKHPTLTPSRSRYLNSYWNRPDLAPRRRGRHRDDLIALYDAGIRWVDEQLRRLAQTLRRFGAWDNCVFALTADHGEEFLEHGGSYHPPSRLNEEIVHVPLLIRAPGTKKVGVSEAPLSHLHLAPTLLDAMNLPAHPDFQGRSFWPELLSGATWSEPAVVESIASCTNPFRPETRLGTRTLAVREARYKLVLSFDPKGEQLFDLVADPAEQRPLPANVETATRRRLLERAGQHLEGSLQTKHPSLRLNACLRQLRLELAQALSVSSRGEWFAT